MSEDHTAAAWHRPIRLSGEHVTLEPLSYAHADGLRAALADGELARAWYTNVPAPEAVEAYVDAALAMQGRGTAWAYAVLDEAQGEGLGRAVWQVMRDENPRLFWRSRHGNPVNPFYYSESDGCLKQEKWKVFWYGMDGFAEIAACVDFAGRRTPTLED